MPTCAHTNLMCSLIFVDGPMTMRKREIGPLENFPNFNNRIVAGTLEAVLHLIGTSTSSAIQLSWQPPFSLNLTTAEPDIVYCVDILNIKSSRS